jgi:hypothetical protein
MLYTRRTEDENSQEMLTYIPCGLARTMSHDFVAALPLQQVSLGVVAEAAEQSCCLFVSHVYTCDTNKQELCNININYHRLTTTTARRRRTVMKEWRGWMVTWWLETHTISSPRCVFKKKYILYFLLITVICTILSTSTKTRHYANGPTTRPCTTNTNNGQWRPHPRSKHESVGRFYTTDPTLASNASWAFFHKIA